MIALAFTLALLGAAPATEAWREHPEFLRGARAFDAQRWDEAADAFAAAYAAHPCRELLWAHAQSLRFAGRCEEALPLYQQFLDADPDADELADVHTNLDACRAEVGAPQEIATPQPATPPRPPAPSVEPNAAARERPSPRGPVDDATPRRRSEPNPRRDRWAHALLWSGVGVAGIGAGLLGAGHARREQAAGARTELAYQAAFAGAPALGNAGIAVLASGATLITAGIVRFAVVAARARRHGRPLARLSTSAGAR